MNQKLTDRLSTLPEGLGKATNIADLTNTLVELERLVLRSNYENRSSGGTPEPFGRQDYVVGEPNTRGLSWKLNLFRELAVANFCQMVRAGVHGGNVYVIGQPENIDTTIRLFTDLVPVYEKMALSEFQSHSDGQQTEEGAPAINKAGWVNQWLINAPSELASAVAESRAKDTAGNRKIADMVAELASELNVFKSSLAPAKPEKAPRAPKAPKEPKSPKAGKAPRSKADLKEDPETTGVPESDESTLETSSESGDSSLTAATEAEAEAEAVTTD